jgi:hypothetical protein
LDSREVIYFCVALIKSIVYDTDYIKPHATGHIGFPLRT